MDSKVTVRVSKFMTNPLLQRKQMAVMLIHPGMGNVSREQVCQMLAKKYKVDAAVISVFGLKCLFGGGKTTGYALIYDNLESMHKFEAKHRLVRKGLLSVTKSSRKQRKVKKNKAKRVKGTKKAAILGQK